MKNIPNILSSSRVPLGLAIAWEGSQSNWAVAFILIVIALATDWFDGVLAKRLNATSDFARDVLEPACDLALTGGAIGGLLISGHLAVVSVVILTVVAVIGQLCVFVARQGSNLQRLVFALMPLGYVAIILLVAADYAIRAFQGDAAWFLVGVLPMALAVVRVKLPRLKTWLGIDT